MAVEQPARRRSVMAARWFAVAYVLASLVTLLIGKPLTPEMPGETAFMVGYCLLGPTSTLAHAVELDHTSAPGWSFHGPIFTYYAVETLLLAGSLLLWTLRFRPARWLSYAATAGLWLGSGYMMGLAWALRT